MLLKEQNPEPLVMPGVCVLITLIHTGRPILLVMGCITTGEQSIGLHPLLCSVTVDPCDQLPHIPVCRLDFRSTAGSTLN